MIAGVISLLLINAIHSTQNQMLSVGFKRTIFIHIPINRAHFHMVTENASTTSNNINHDFDHFTSLRPNQVVASSVLEVLASPGEFDVILRHFRATFADSWESNKSAGGGRRDRIKAEIRREDMNIHELSWEVCQTLQSM